MMTDTNRKLRSDPGNPEVCPVFDYHKVFSDEEERSFVTDGCKNATIGCIDCKKVLIKNILSFLEPIQAKRAEYEKIIDDLDEFLSKTQQKANDVAAGTVKKVRKVLRI
jgi:tryptophanyl-tRNA synthetase